MQSLRIKSPGIQRHVPPPLVPAYLFLKRTLGSAALRYRLRSYRAKPKIFYLLIPPPYLRNLGDHAQVLGIRSWLAQAFPDRPVLEFDKAQTSNYLDAISRLSNPQDIIMLQSGGNMGDRGLWTEYIRRDVVRYLPKNRIISLPQTIYFSNTECGRTELARSKTVYNMHNNLTIMARDERSFLLAAKYFPSCRRMLCPDFVLNLTPPPANRREREGVLVCLRTDGETALRPSQRTAIQKQAARPGFALREWDTDVDYDITPVRRQQIVRRALQFVMSHRAVVTDRLHAVIFAVLTRTPCVALRSADHKLAESMKWFSGLDYVRYAGGTVRHVGVLLDEVLSVQEVESCNWSSRYFDGLKEALNLS